MKIDLIKERTHIDTNHGRENWASAIKALNLDSFTGELF